MGTFVNQTSGIAPANGTSSHTISFGFTAAAGNILVVIVSGSVTNAATGWTKQLGPVNSAETSVFTKTATGADTITVTHNGSNYPVGWVAYEFPSGTTYLAGTSSSNTFVDTFPALAGLGTTDKFVIGARGRAANNSAVTGATSTWSAPSVKSADLFIARNGTTAIDGMYVTVGHITSTTAASVTPVASTTVTPSDNLAGDREYVVFALTVPAGISVQTVTLSPAVIAATPNPVTPVPLAPSVSLSPALMGVAPPTVQPGSGAVSLSLTPAGFSIGVQPVTPAPQPVTVVLSALLTVTGTPVPVTPVPGVLSVSLSPAGMALTVAPVTPGTGAVSVALSPAGFTVGPVSVQAASGPVTMSLSPAAVSLSPVPVSTGVAPVAVSLASASLTISAVPVAVVPLPVTVVASPAVLGVLPVPVTPVPGSVTVTVLPAGITVGPVAVSNGLGSVTLSLSPAVFAVTATAVSAVPGRPSVALSPALITIGSVPVNIGGRLRLVKFGGQWVLAQHFVRSGGRWKPV